MRLRTKLKWVFAAGVIALATSAGAQQGTTGAGTTGQGTQGTTQGSGSTQAGSTQGAGGAGGGVSGSGGFGAGAGGAGAGGSATGGAAGQVTFTAPSRLSPAEELAQAETWLTRMTQAANNTRVMLELARKERDVIKILCLNEKLSQLDAAVRTGRERRNSLQSAANRNDVDLAYHEYTVLSVLKQRADQTSAEAGQCVGKDDATVAGGQGTVTTTIDPTILANPTGDSTKFPEIDTPQPALSDPPQAISPSG